MSTHTIAGPAKDKPGKETVRCLVDDLQKSVEILHEELTELAEKLLPVLEPDTDTHTCPLQQDPPEWFSPVMLDMFRAIAALNDGIRRVRNTHNGLTV